MKTKMKSKNLFALFLACLMVVALAACSGNTGKPAESSAPVSNGTESSAAPATDSTPAESDRTLNIAVMNDPGTLHPLSQTGDGGFSDITHAMYDAPVDVLQDGTIEYVLLESYDVISETHYTLHLRKDVVFNNGNPFTAEDFMFSAELSRDHPQYSVNVKTWDFEKTNIIDDYTVDLWLTAFDVGMFPAMSWLYMFDKESYDEAALALTPNGTGAYILKEYVVNSHVVVEANPNYWGEQPAIKTVKFLVFNEDSQRVNALVTGDVDQARIPAKDVEYVKSLGNYSVLKSSPAQTTVAYFNVGEGAALGTLDARLAVMYAIDRQAIVNIAYKGESSCPSWPNSEDCTDYEPRFSNAIDTYKTGYNQDLAKQYAEKSGLTSQTLRIINNGTELYSTIAQVIQENLSAIGVKSEIISYDQATFFSILMDASNYDIGLFLMSAPSRFAIEQMTSWPGFIPMGWSGADREKFIELGQKGMATADDAARAEILQEMLDIFATNQPWFALAENVSHRAVSNDLGGHALYADGLRFKNWYWK